MIWTSALNISGLACAVILATILFEAWRRQQGKPFPYGCGVTGGAAVLIALAAAIVAAFTWIFGI